MVREFAELIRVRRAAQRMTLESLATASGLSLGRISQVEKGLGGLPKQWWRLTDALKLPRETAIRAMDRKMGVRALSALLSAGEENPFKKEAIFAPSTVAGEPPYGYGEMTFPDDRSTSLRPVITPAQARAGRALLGWTQGELAEAAGVAKTTVRNFETSAWSGSPETTKALRDAFNQNGIILEGEGELINGGAGVRYALPD